LNSASEALAGASFASNPVIGPAGTPPRKVVAERARQSSVSASASVKTMKVERKAGIGGDVEREDVATLHRKFVDEALGQGRAARTFTAAAGNHLDSIVIAGHFGLPLAVEDRLEHRRPVARQHQDHARFCLEFGRQHRGPGPDVLAFALDRLDRGLGSGNASSALSSSSRIAACSS
jgi:hypothetical protein